jgi:hypothetical protein
MRKVRCNIGSTTYFQDMNTYISLEVKPSINFALTHYSDFISWPVPYTPPYLSVPDIDYAAEVTFRGFGFNSSDFYKIDIPENYAISGSNNYPAYGWGY